METMRADDGVQANDGVQQMIGNTQGDGSLRGVFGQAQGSVQGESASLMMNGKSLTFEEALMRLEGIVGQLENGGLPLEESMKAFEEGMRLQAFCAARLAEAEKKMEILVRNRETNALSWQGSNG